MGLPLKSYNNGIHARVDNLSGLGNYKTIFADVWNLEKMSGVRICPVVIHARVHEGITTATDTASPIIYPLPITCHYTSVLLTAFSYHASFYPLII